MVPHRISDYRTFRVDRNNDLIRPSPPDARLAQCPGADDTSNTGPPISVPSREQQAYLKARSLHYVYFAETDRSVIPKMMQAFRRPPNSTEVFELIDWLAERDALIARAEALAYVIGELRSVRSSASSWEAISSGRSCGMPFVYWTGGQVSWRTPVPNNGDATLMNRGWVMLDDGDTAPRPYIAIPRWFLLEPTQG